MLIAYFPGCLKGNVLHSRAGCRHAVVVGRVAVRQVARWRVGSGMPRGLLQEVCHGSGNSGNTPALPGLPHVRARSSISFESACPQLIARRRGSALQAATSFAAGSARTRASSLRVAFGDFLASDDRQFVPEPQDLQQEGLDLASFGRDGRLLSGGAGMRLDIPGTNLQMELPPLPPPPSQLLDGGIGDGGPLSLAGGSPDDHNAPGNVIEYWAIDGSGGGHGDHVSHSSHSSGHHGPAGSAPAEHHEERHHDHHGDAAQPHEAEQQAEDPVDNEPPIVIDLTKKDHGLQPSVVAGGVLALFAQAYLWGNVFVTLFKPARRLETPVVPPDVATAGDGSGRAPSPQVGGLAASAPGTGAGGLVTDSSASGAAGSEPTFSGAGGVSVGTNAVGTASASSAGPSLPIGDAGSSSSAAASGTSGAIGNRLDGSPVPIAAA